MTDTNTDRELLEMAAKAYWGDEIDDVCSIEWSEEDQAIAYTHADNQDHNGLDRTCVWNPLEDDGDCARMEARCGISIQWLSQGVEAWLLLLPRPLNRHEAFRCHGNDKSAARRRASVRAAAEIGRAMG